MSRNVVISGVAGALGSALARAFSQQGDRVAGLWHERFPVDPGALAWETSLDILDGARVKEAFGQLGREFGDIDVLVHAAGSAADGLLLGQTAEIWEETVRTHLFGAAALCRQAGKAMLTRHAGSIILIGSLAAGHPRAGQSAYAAAKAGMEGLVRALAVEWGGKGIRVNALAPGFLEGGLAAGLPEEVKNELVAQAPLKRLGRMDEVAAAAVFLASGRAGYITGQVWGVDGGLGM